jgi:hypothetical protein
MVRYRLGRFERARATLAAVQRATGAIDRKECSAYSPLEAWRSVIRAECLAFLAMAESRLAHPGQACATLDKLRSMMEDHEGTDFHQQRPFLREAESLILNERCVR